MKCFLLILALIFLNISVNAQFRKPSNPEQMKTSFFSFHASMADYQTFLSQDGKEQGSLQEKAGKSFGFGVGWWKGLTSHLDFHARYTGTFSNFPAGFLKNDSIGTAGFSNEISGSIVYRFMDDRALLNPFVSAGLGAGTYQPGAAIIAPLSAGLQVKTASGFYLFAQAQMNLNVAGSATSPYMHYSLGFAQAISHKKLPTIVLTPEIPATNDFDHDGIRDEFDGCPLVAGPEKYHGCPDTDGDGIMDPSDACPTQAGHYRYMGCPVPDVDGDGIDDENDKCPLQAGSSEFQGCPIPDSDGDGIPDDIDPCPQVAGEAGNNGCPVIEQKIRDQSIRSAREIMFQPNSDQLVQPAKKALLEIVRILNSDSQLKLRIEGHTDNTGQHNLELSEKRAQAVRAFFLNHKILPERLDAFGLGDTRPIASNDTPEGRAKNRRVELIFNY